MICWKCTFPRKTPCPRPKASQMLFFCIHLFCHVSNYVHDKFRKNRSRRYEIRVKMVSIFFSGHPVCNRTKTRFENHHKWLKVVGCLVNPVYKEAAKNISTPGGSRGRPALPFREKCRRAKQHATAALRRSATTSELVFSAASAVHQAGRRRAARLLEEAESPRRGSLLVSRAAKTPESHRTTPQKRRLP